MLFAPTLDDNVILQRARSRGPANGLQYAGSVLPDEVWELYSRGARLIDVRTLEERRFAGYVPGSLHVAWLVGSALAKNPRFIKELNSKVQSYETLVFMCLSGKRSAEAAAAANKAGFVNTFSLLGSVEANTLPWIKD